ncbi:MAG: hypothetical protein IPN94_09975 [Sphingobacteriales bacterium]|nr:hypothetical protein [Sphingobacteriales bacterium]
MRIFSSSNSGCYIDRTVTLTNVTCGCPTIMVAPTTAAVCAGSANISFTQTGGVTGGTWTIDSPASGGGSIVAATGVYTPPATVVSATTVVIKYNEPSPSNCFGTHTITINPIPSAPTATVTTQPTCSVATGTITVTAPATGAGITYTVTGTSPVVAGVTQATTTFAGLAAGVYDVITTVNGCTSLPTSLTVNAQPTPPVAGTASTTIQPTCALAAGTIVVNGPNRAVEYNIDGGVYQASATFAGVSAGSHTILVRSTADNTCVSSGTSVTVNAQPTPPVAATASTTIQPTCALATGTTVVTAPTGAVEYNIDGGTYQASGTFAGVSAGSHTILVRSTADNTCVSSETSVTVNAQPTPPAAATASTTIQPTCALATGTIVVTAPTGAVEYNIDGGSYQASGTFAGVSAGSHTILVRSTTDNTCVSSSTSVSVDAQPTPPAAATASTTIQPTCATATGTIVVTAPTGAVEYNIDGSYQASATFAGIAAGSHTILVRSTADNTCVSSGTSVTVNAQPTAPAAATASTTIQPTCALATGTVVVTAPTGAVEYNIDGGTYQASDTLRVLRRVRTPFGTRLPTILGFFINKC